MKSIVSYIKDLIINILAITDIPFEKLSEIIKLFFMELIFLKNVFDGIYYENIRWKIYEDINQIQNDIKNGIIELSGVIHYWGLSTAYAFFENSDIPYLHNGIFRILLFFMRKLYI